MGKELGPSKETIVEVEKLVNIYEAIQRAVNLEFEERIRMIRVESITLDDINLREELGGLLHELLEDGLLDYYMYKKTGNKVVS